MYGQLGRRVFNVTAGSSPVLRTPSARPTPVYHFSNVILGLSVHREDGPGLQDDLDQ